MVASAARSWSLLSLLLVACVGQASPRSAPPAVEPSAPQATLPARDAELAWEELKRALPGSWRATFDGNRTINISYKLISRGSALMETFTTASGTETLTVYHRDGDALMLTHYCAQGNQVRLRATQASRERIVFEFLDATNEQADQGVMQSLIVRLQPDGFDQESVYREAGKLDPMTLHFTPVPPAVGETAMIDAELSVRAISADTYVVTHAPFFAANILVARMPDGTVVLGSSPYETQAARALVRWVKRTLAPTRIVAINTHFHFDGTGGNEAYREAGVITYASEHTQQLVLQRNPALKQEWAKDFKDPEQRRRVEAMKVVPAEKTFPERDGLALTFGGEAVRVIYPGPGHAPDNVLVYLPSRGVLFGGCMIKASPSIGFLGHADLSRWEPAVEVARGLGARIVIPGHGEVGGPELFDLTISLVRDAKAKQPK